MRSNLLTKIALNQKKPYRHEGKKWTKGQVLLAQATKIQIFFVNKVNDVEI